MSPAAARGGGKKRRDPLQLAVSPRQHAATEDPLRTTHLHPCHPFAHSDSQPEPVPALRREWKVVREQKVTRETLLTQQQSNRQQEETRADHRRRHADTDESSSDLSSFREEPEK